MTDWRKKLLNLLVVSQKKPSFAAINTTTKL